MKENTIQLALDLTAPKGAVLTAKEIERCGVTAFGVELLSLLFKPGINYFETNHCLADYFALQGQWLLDSRLKWNAEKNAFAIRSPFDGHYDFLPLEQWLSVVNHMNPDALILPEGFNLDESQWHSKLNPSIRCYSKALDSEQIYPDGELYLSDKNSPAILLTDADWSGLIKFQSQHSTLLIHSMRPVSDAVDGMVYLNEQLMDIKQDCWTKDFQLIQQNCQCMTCQQKLTRAYFYHLYQQTPLLCHRFLAEHNLWMTQQLFGS